MYCRYRSYVEALGTYYFFEKLRISNIIGKHNEILGAIFLTFPEYVINKILPKSNPPQLTMNVENFSKK